MPIPATITKQISDCDNSLEQATWVLVSLTPDGYPVQIPEWADCTFHVGVTGDNFGGATVLIEGSHNGVDWFTMHNAGDYSLMSFTAAAMKTMLELPRYLRPNLSPVGVEASVTVILLARRANPMRQ